MIKIGADSPIARLMARIEPVIMPGIADGSVMFQITCHGVAPNPRAPARRELGTARNDSWVLMMMTGSVTNMSVKAPANTPRPNGRRK